VKSNLQKKVLTVRGKKGTHRQTYYVADAPTLAKSGHTIPTVVTPRERATVHYGMLWASSANRGVDHALAAIAKTHDVPHNLHKIDIHVTGSLGGAGGQYHVYGSKAPGISISKHNAGPAFTAAHEYGHFLDHHLFGSGKPRFNSLATADRNNAKVQAELHDLKRALYNSAAVKQLVEKHEHHVRGRDYSGQQNTQYLLMPPEIFARAYSQWVSTRSSPQMLSECHDFGAHWRRSGYHAQWDDKDFEPIAREFDRLFANRGLRRGRR
jgi:hypothetical protein